MCQDIPPPPPGAATDLDAVEGGTMRDKLEEHATNPACSGCHLAMDPPGFALEHFDPIGRWRDSDNGFPIDATGDIDGAPFDGAVELGRVAPRRRSTRVRGDRALPVRERAGGAVEDLGTIQGIGGRYTPPPASGSRPWCGRSSSPTRSGTPWPRSARPASPRRDPRLRHVLRDRHG